MSESALVTLQINLTPTDLPHATHILPHQLRQLAGQVDEILFVVDTRRSLGRRGESWRERLPGLQQLLVDCCRRYAHARVVLVDYSPEVVHRVSDFFVGGQPLPAKDCDGAPVYAYLFSLMEARNSYVFHLDSDMLYGGGSQTWVREGVELLKRHADVLICSPLPGPPTAHGELRSQHEEREPYTSLAYRGQGLSTRHFLIDLERFRARIGQLPPLRTARVFQTLRAASEGYPTYLPLENWFSQAMVQHDLRRVEFLGDDPGMWSVHPLYRSQRFYDRLPSLIAEIEAGEVPEAQRGDHNLNESMVDWTGATRSGWERMVAHGRLAYERWLGDGRQPVSVEDIDFGSVAEVERAASAQYSAQ